MRNSHSRSKLKTDYDYFAIIPVICCSWLHYNPTNICINPDGFIGLWIRWSLILELSTLSLLQSSSPRTKSFDRFKTRFNQDFDKIKIKKAFPQPREKNVKAIRSFKFKILGWTSFSKHKSAGTPQSESASPKVPTQQQQLLQDIQSLSA